MTKKMLRRMVSLALESDWDDAQVAEYEALKFEFESWEPDAGWTLVLNKYQRDNLLWLINAVWEGVGPFGLANTGDWLGEVGWMLKDDDDTAPVLDEHDRPNRSLEELRRLVAAHWERRSLPGPKEE